MRRPRPRSGPLRPLATTICSTTLLLVLAGGAEAGDRVTEADLVARYLAGPAVEAELDAWRARARAAGTAEVDVPNPRLEYRHEEVPGAGGERTDSVGASLTLDLGMTAVPRRASADAREGAVRASRSGALLDAVCSLRRDAGRLGAARQERAVRARAQGRLEELASALSELARLGEASGYDRDRAVLAAASHRLAVAEAAAEEQATRASIEGRVGGGVDGLELQTLPTPADLPALLATGREHPDLVALRKARDAAERGQVAARRTAAPDLTLSGAARFDTPPEGGAPRPGFEVGVALELPVVDRARHDVAAAGAEVSVADAELLRREREVAAEIEAAWRRAAVAAEVGPLGVDPGVVWTAARDRYAGGEASIDELLQTARDVEEARLSELGVRRLARAARLDLACAVGRFHDPAVQSAFEEALR